MGRVIKISLGLGLLTYVFTRLSQGKCYSKKSLTGKTVIITGANSGIGYETALDLARRNGKIIMACRNHVTGSEARDKIIELTGNTNVIFKQLDLSLMKSIRSFATEILAEENQIDILINNAGIYNSNKVITEEGFEETYATNHFGPFLLTNLLLINIPNDGRVVNVGSNANIMGKVDCSNLRAEKSFSSMQYHNSKLASLLFTKELARRVADTGIKVICVHPGTVRTNVFRNLPLPFQWILFTIGRIFTKSAEEGAQPVLFCALDDSVENGGYYMDCQLYSHSMWVNKEAENTSLAKELWDTSAKLVDLKS